MEEGGLLLSDAVLSADGPVDLADVVHDERLDHRLDTLLQTLVVVSGKDNIQMKVAISDMTVSIWKDLSFFLLSELC